jgi:peroxiredoxin
MPLTSLRLAALVAAAVSLPAQAALREGAVAPAFEAPAARAGQPVAFKLQEALANGPVVVYFYPAAFTGGCNLQAHHFAENLPRFTAAGATVVGVSLDRIERLQAFSADPETCAGRLTVASDRDGRIARAFEIATTETPEGRKNLKGEDIDHARAERTSFVIGRDGRVAAVIAGLSPVGNVNAALLAVQKLKP